MNRSDNTFIPTTERSTGTYKQMAQNRSASSISYRRNKAKHIYQPAVTEHKDDRSKWCCFSAEQLPLGLHRLTSSVSSTPHSFQATSSTKTVVSPRQTRPVVRTWSLHCHQLAWRVIVSAHFCSAALEDLNVPKMCFHRE